MLNFNYREVVLEVMSQSVRAFLFISTGKHFLTVELLGFMIKMVKNEELFIRVFKTENSHLKDIRYTIRFLIPRGECTTIILKNSFLD